MQYPFVPPNSAYEDSIYPVDESLVVTSTNVYMARGVGIATVVVTPMQYSPSTGELFLCEYISFTINYAGMDGPPQQYSFRSARVGRALSDYIKLMVDNDPDVDNIIPIIPEPPPRPPDGVFPDYMIITDANMAASFEPLRIWKTKKGIPTRTVILETDIYAYFEGVDNAEKIRNFIISKADSGLFYVLLGGNADVIPVRYAYQYNVNQIPGNLWALSPCDLYYADIDNVDFNPEHDWDRDLDGVYGEPNDDNPDLAADVMIGRVPVAGPDSAAVFLEKLLRYEKNPGNGDANYLTTAVISASDQPRDYNNFGQYVNAMPSYFNFNLTTLFEQPSGAADPATHPSGEEVISFLNGNHPAIYISEGHGSPWDFNALANGYNGDIRSVVSIHPQNNPPYFDGSILDVNTGGRDYCHFGCQCLLGAFDCKDLPYNPPPPPCPSFAEGSISLPGGSVACTFNTRDGYVSSSHDLEVRKFNLLGDESLFHRISSAHYSAKWLYPGEIYRKLDYRNTYFGDPEMAIWTDVPHTMVVTYPERIWPEVLQEVTVTTCYGSPLSGVDVTLWKDADFYERGVTDQNGVALFSVNPAFEGTAFLVCYKPNYYPFEGSMAALNDCGDAVAGDANGNGTCNGIDAVFLVAYLKGIGAPPPDSCQCPTPDFLYLSADANGNCEVNGLDITYLQYYFRGSGPAPTFCADCPVWGLMNKKKPYESQTGGEAKNENQ
jgi:hypothetical protein